MTDTDFQAATDLARVRALKQLIEELDPSVGEIITDEEHAVLRRTARAWEQRLVQSIGPLRRPRADKQTKMFEEGAKK